MGKINIGRVVIAGLVAGIVADVLGYLVDGVMLAPQWAVGMQNLGHGAFPVSAWIAFNMLGLIGGIVTIWIYAGIRPRFGAGVGTAVRAGIVAWLLTNMIPNLSFMWVAQLFSRHLTVFTTAGGLVEIVVGTIAGAALYKE